MKWGGGEISTHREKCYLIAINASGLGGQLTPDVNPR